MAGINKDERQFVTESFVKKCREVGIKLYYTSETLSEIYHVIEGQIKYIRFLTQEQPPVDSKTIQAIDSTNEFNDFYVLYYNWCKSSQNKFNDYLSFQKYLIRLIRNVIENLIYINIPNMELSEGKKAFEIQCLSLDEFKKEKRPNKPNSKESLKVDINNILYILSLRNKSQSQNLWQINDYIVSADQLLTTWAGTAYHGIPIVVIPSTWLSIILRFTGRSADDYKAYCLFMGLRQHKTEDDFVTINPVELLMALSKKTTEQEIKQQIIEEILENKNEYEFKSSEDYAAAVNDAFGKILKRSAEEIKLKYTEIIDKKEKENTMKMEVLNEQLKLKSTEDEYILRIANNKAKIKVEKWKQLEFLKVLIPLISVICAIIFTVAIWFKVEPVYSFISNILLVTNVEGLSSWSLFTWIMSLLLGAIPNFLIIAPVKYLSSESRKQHLILKYLKDGQKYL